MRKLPPGLLRVVLLGSALMFFGAVLCGGAAHSESGCADAVGRNGNGLSPCAPSFGEAYDRGRAVGSGYAAADGTLFPGDCEARAEKWWGVIARMESIDPDHYEPRFSRDLQSFVAGYCWREMFH